MIKIKSFVPFSLIDYPGKVSSVIFTGGCNFRCPWCQNYDLVDEGKLNKIEDIPLDYILNYLSKRKGLIDGVCVSGGEPTIHGEELLNLVKIIKDKDFLIKLDTNGSNPALVASLIDKKLVDYVAMDLKNSFEKYNQTIGLKDFNTSLIKESIDILKGSDVEYQIRTTLVENIVDKKEIEDFAAKLGVKIKFQDYRNPLN